MEAIANRATYRDFLEYLKKLETDKDVRLDDNITVREQDGEYYPAEFLEFNGDDILDENHVVIVTLDWNEHL